MRNHPAPCDRKPVAPRAEPRIASQAAPADELEQLLRLEQQSLWTTRRLRIAVLSASDRSEIGR